MVGASLLPFPLATGVNTPGRTGLSTTGSTASDDFGGAMDGALGADRQTRRADTGVRARRAEPAKPGEAADARPASASRKAAVPARPAARQADRADDAEPTEANADRSSEAEEHAGAADSSDPTKAEAKTTGDAAAPADEGTGASAEDAAACAAEAATAALALTDEGDGDALVADGDDPLARGRRWTSAASDGAAQAHETATNGAATRGAGGQGLPLQAGQRARAEAAGTPGQALAEIAQEMVASVPADAVVGQQAAQNAPVTNGALESTAANPQTASSADASTLIENAIAAVEDVAKAEASADAGASDEQPHEQPESKPQASSAQSNANLAVAAAGPSDGVRFTVTGAVGNAAYTNAAPRDEEAVLPQIVQSIRLQAVQGTTEARVQLKPEHLGVLNITLKVEQNQVTATIQADVAAVRQWIESHESSLRQALSEQGLQLAKLVVHPDGQQTGRDDEQGEERPHRQPRRRSWRDEEQTFEVLV